MSSPTRALPSTQSFMGNYISESKKKRDNGTRICRLCNRQENYKHILRECIALKDERDKLCDLDEGGIGIGNLNGKNKTKLYNIIKCINNWEEIRK